MRRRRVQTFRCYAVLLLMIVTSFAVSMGEPTANDDARNDNSTIPSPTRGTFHNVPTRNPNEVESTSRYEPRVANSTWSNDTRHEYRDDSTSNIREDGDSARYESRAYSTKRISVPVSATKPRANDSTTASDGASIDNSTSLRGNFTRMLHESDDNGKSTTTTTTNLAYDLRKSNSDEEAPTNDKIVPYEVCDDGTCIQLCCPLGYRLIQDRCVVGQGRYSFPDVYVDATGGGDGEDARFDRVFRLVVRDPCKETGRYLLNPDDYPEDEYMFFINGTLYQPQHDEYLRAMSYCLAVVNRDRYDVTVCFANETTDQPANTLTIGTPIGLIVSLPFLLVTFVVYSILPELWNMHGYTLRCYVGSLFVTYTVLAVLQLTRPEILAVSVCIALAFVIYFSFLASFFWLNVMCFDIWWTFGGFRSLQGSVKQRERKKFVMYSIYAWGSASGFTIICAIMDFVPSVPENLIRPEFGAEKCWFLTEPAKALYFYGPMGITVVCNICLFISTALKIVRHKKDTAHHLRGSESRRHDDNKQWFNLYLKLFIVMGITWSMEIVSWLFNKNTPDYLWYLTDLTNTLQGLIIFIIFVWKEKIKRLLFKRFGCQDRGIFSRNSTRSVGLHSSASRTCTTTSGVIPLQEKISPYVQVNCRTKSTSIDSVDP